jgi:hypothetical protein
VASCSAAMLLLTSEQAEGKRALGVLQLPLGSLTSRFAWAGYACLVNSDRRELPWYFSPLLQLVTTDTVCEDIENTRCCCKVSGTIVFPADPTPATPPQTWRSVHEQLPVLCAQRRYASKHPKSDKRLIEPSAAFSSSPFCFWYAIDHRGPQLPALILCLSSPNMQLLFIL